MDTFVTTITQKGQITIPKKVRELLGVHQGERIELSVVDEKNGQIQVRPLPDIMDLAGSFKVDKSVDPVKIREYMEDHYERV